MSDIVERLRTLQRCDEAGEIFSHNRDIWKCAADEIERLRGEKSYLEDEVIPALRSEIERLELRVL